MAVRVSRETIKFPKKIVDHYINILENEIKIKGVLLFGSFAYGKPDKHSDVDLAIISPDFKKMNFYKRMDWLQFQRDKTTFQIAMDVIGYTPHEFRWIDRHSAIMKVAKKRGKWLYLKNPKHKIQNLK